MADSIDEIRKDTNNLTDAMRRLNETTGGAIRAFGEFGSATGKVGRAWTILSRITSGSGFWQIQNRIRSVSNTFELITKATDAQREKTMQSLEANFKLAESYNKLVAERKNIEGTALYQMLLKDTNATIATREATKEYTNVINKLNDEMNKRGKSIRKQFGLEKGSLTLLKERIKKEGVLAEITRPTRKVLGRIQDTFLGKKGTGFRAGMQINEENVYSRRGLLRQAGRGAAAYGRFSLNIFKGLGSFIKLGTLFFSKFLVLGAAISLIAGLLFLFFRKTWPTLQGFLVDAFSNFKAAFGSILKVVVGVFSLFKALFEGRLLDAIGILLKDIMLNLLKAALQIVGGLINVLVGVVVSAIVGLGKTIKATFMGFIKKIPGFASGGTIGHNGLSLVGEQGPELVRLPVGSRVFSNAESKRMVGGTTNITVQVTGRVGASDMEIRDIAQKVSREIGLQMNRTGSTAVRF